MIIYRYFAREVLSTMIAVTGIVLLLSLGWRFNGYLNEAASGVLSSDILFLLIMYRLPSLLELIVPISFFLSLILTYGRLYADSEMTVLECSGMGPAKLMSITLFQAGFVMLLAAIISLWLKPAGEQEVESLLTDQQSLSEFDTLAEGRFQTTKSGKRVAYTEELDNNGNLRNVFMNESNVGIAAGLRKVTTIMAASGETQVDELGNRFLVLKNGSQYSGEPGSLNYQVIEYEEYGQLIGKELSHTRLKRLTAIPTEELLTASDAGSISELHWRMSVVLMIPLIALMAIPLSRVNPRQGRFTKLIPGMLLCLFYVASLSGAKTGMQLENLPFGAIWWVHGVFILITLMLYKLPLIDRLIRGA